jgi:hypothetical protein
MSGISDRDRMTIGKTLKYLLCGLIAAPLVVILVSACSPEAGTAPESTPGRRILPDSTPVLPEAHAVTMGDADLRLAAPALSNPPTQTELGQYHYWMSCMVCHGDRGQGLTVEWRSLLDPADQNCWQSKCHAPNHPPEGFEIPREAPLVMGTGALSGYETAADLYEYLSETMPWSFPGLLPDEAYWQLTAYLAESNNVDYGRKQLGPDNAGDVLLRPGLVQTHHSGARGERVAAGAVLVLLVGTVILGRWSQTR